MARILMTGAAGRIGTTCAPLLVERGHELTLLDREPCDPALGRVVTASATDEAAMTAAARGQDLLLHLASFSGERPWRDIIDVNIESARVALDAARAAEVPVTVLASSVHATGFTPSDAAGDRVPRTRPDTYYGLSKVVAEALADLYADRFAMRVVCLRIMTFDTRPRTARARSTWLSPGDLVRLVEACRTAPVGSSIVWGVSANTRRTVSLEAGRALGYEPQDDAEDHLGPLMADLGVDSPGAIEPVGSSPLGGGFTTGPLGKAW